LGNAAQALFLKNSIRPFRVFQSLRRYSPQSRPNQKPKIEKPDPKANFSAFIVATKSNASAAQAPSFEDAMQRLEAIVEAMESGETPLADLLAKFEEGSKLLAICEQRLQAAELRIEQLKRAKDGSALLEPFAATPRPEPGQD
jgi:exodeoxyribonuclease VII small subunit